MKTIAMVGLGIIGNTWARNLVEDGLTVRGWNRTPKDVPYYEPDLGRATENSAMIVIVVADPPAVDSVLDQIVPCLKKGQIVVQASTISSEWTLKFAQRVEAAGAVFLEAPFTGSKPAAETRKTVFYLGGTKETIENAKPVLSRLSTHLLHVGPIGSASSLKLAMNLNIALVCEGLSESLALARREGISDDVYFEALSINVGKSGLSDMKGPKIREGDFTPQFSLKHMDKDLRLALETAGPLELPAARALKSLYDKGMQQGYQDDDFAGLIRSLTTKKSVSN